MEQKQLASLVRALTLAVAEIAFVGLIGSFVWRTFAAKTGAPPDLPEVQASAAGALAVALGGGYALALGIPASNTSVAESGLYGTVKWLLKEKFWLSVGVFAYFAAGVAACAAYGLNEAEAPGILKTIAVGFGGYVISYIGIAYRQLSE